MQGASSKRPHRSSSSETLRRAAPEHSSARFFTEGRSRKSCSSAKDGQEHTSRRVDQHSLFSPNQRNEDDDKLQIASVHDRVARISRVNYVSAIARLGPGA